MPTDLSKYPHWQKLAEKNPAYRKSLNAVIGSPLEPGDKAKARPKSTNPQKLSEGAGTELKKMLHSIGIDPSGNCACNGRARVMDDRGIDWCEENVELIVDWLQEEATRRHLPFARVAGKMIINRAIRNARKAAKMEPAKRQVKRKVPEIGMISPADQSRIQIEITNACPHACSNCTRFTRLVKQPFFMDMDTFQRAVDSMKGYEGMVGIMGGEPTLHPQFSEFVRYYGENWNPRLPLTDCYSPLSDFASYYRKSRSSIRDKRRGLWTSTGPGYYQHYEQIQEVFDYQCINTHENDTKHQTLLITRREAGISDEEWPAIRDRCWVQRLWSSSITPKGAFFCEVAAALDMLYDGPGGWPIEPGWWRREPKDFGSQLDWCELCSASFSPRVREARDEVQEMSPEHFMRLGKQGWPETNYGRVQVLRASEFIVYGVQVKDADWYLPKADKRKRVVSVDELTPQRIDGIIVSVDCGDQLRRTLPFNRSHFDRLVVVTTPDDIVTQEVAREHNAEVLLSDSCYYEGDAFNKGRMLNAVLEGFKFDDWLLFTDADCFLPVNLRKDLRGLVLNPGCLYYSKRFHVPGDATAPDWSLITNQHKLDLAGNTEPWGYFQLVNARASVLQPFERFRFPTCFCSAGAVDSWFMSRWPEKKRVLIGGNEKQWSVLHLWHGTFASRWNNRGSQGGWIHSGQGRQGIALPKLLDGWPDDCLVRRVNIDTLAESIIHWRRGDGWPAVWEDSLGVMCEYAVKPCPEITDER